MTNPADSLSQELDTANQLLQLLKQEQSLLVNASIDGMGALIGQKSALIARMAELADARLSALSKVGFAAEESSMQKWLSSSASADVVNRTSAKKTWEALTTQISNAKELNRTNGLLIGTHMSRNQAALQVLQGNQGSQVYGKDGQTSVQSSRRSLIVS